MPINRLQSRQEKLDRMFEFTNDLVIRALLTLAILASGTVLSDQEEPIALDWLTRSPVGRLLSPPLFARLHLLAENARRRRA
jgi:hypothetical protein